MRSLLISGLSLTCAGACLVAATVPAVEPATGWRGNATGLWPEARVPREWSRMARGGLDGLRAQSDRPENGPPGTAPAVARGLVTDWLVLGPLPLEDSVKDFDQDLLGGEAAAFPVVGGKVGERAWTRFASPRDDPSVFGTAELPWLDLAKAVGFAPNQAAYAHSYVYSPRGGPARGVVEHGHGLKVWVNGREVYRSPQRGGGLGYYTAISRHELRFEQSPSPQFELELRPGWNRLLLKLTTSNRDDYKDMRCCLRIMDPPGVAYESRNIAWMAELPGRSTSTPILVKDRLLAMCEPDTLVCVDAASGRELWSAFVNCYEALRPAEKQARPEYAAQVDPLVAELKAVADPLRRLAHRRKIGETLERIDKGRFTQEHDGHFESHFGIVGYTMPTPVSDGERIYVWSGMGVAACFDLDGNREWITRIDTGALTYGSTPALADGVLVAFLNKLFGLDARTGALKWTQPRVQKNVASLMAARIDGHDVVVTQQGELIRPADGEILFRPRGITPGDTGWSPPVILGDTLYLPRYGVAELNGFDFRGSAADGWKPAETWSISWSSDINKGPDGKWLDRWTAGSPLIHDGLAWEVDMYQVLYAIDLRERQPLFRAPLDLDGFTHYNALAVAASPTLIGRHILVCDNQGTTLVLEPGRELKVIAKNRIATQLERWWPLPAQETLAYAPPITDGTRLFLRGERYLYCIAE